MAYSGRQRDQILDERMWEVIEKRGREMLGLVLVILAAFCALALASYTPADPGWLSATGREVQNVLGLGGAFTASLVMVLIGWSGWLLVLFLVVWGVRVMTGRRPATALLRALPWLLAGLVIGASFLASHAPPRGWSQSFGLGGVVGDTILGLLLQILPLPLLWSYRLTTIALALLSLWIMGHALGIGRGERRQLLVWFLYGLAVVWGWLMAVPGALFRGMAGLGRWAASRARRSSGAAAGAPDAAPDTPLAEPVPEGRFRFALFRSARSSNRSDRAERESRIDGAGSTAEPLAAGSGDGVAGEDVDRRIRARIRDILSRRSEGPARRAAAPRDAGAPAAENAAPAEAVSAVPEVRHTLAPPPIERADAGAPAAPVQPRVAPPLHGPEVAPPPKPVPAARSTLDSAQGRLPLVEGEAAGYEPPPLALLTDPGTIERHVPPREALEESARMLESVLADYGVKGEIVAVRPGPVVTMYELEPAPGLKASRVIGLADDIARSMSALSARISTIPGRNVIGIELPNPRREIVLLREVLASRKYADASMRLPLALGKDISGTPVVTNLARMPHLLIAGTTGSGKSVAINTMILSLLYKLPPEECRLIMIDPKMLELSVYDGIPHLLAPVVTDPKKAVVALKWVVAEMEERYRKMSKMGVRNIEGYNSRVREALERGEMFSRTVQTGFDEETGEPIFETESIPPEPFPYIVVIVDEMADLMMVAGKEIEACIQRLAQMARASGIHLIMATQRPSVDVITGTIKANFPTRISFQVTSKIDSRTILGEQGAEQLLGQGDMLFMEGGGRITRVHGPFVSDEEVEEVVAHLRAQGAPEYVADVLKGPDPEREDALDAVLGLGGNTGGEDALYDQAVAIVLKDRKCSTSYIQRKLGIGYNKAARLVERMEDEGLVSPANRVGKREILVPEEGGI